MFGEQTLIQTNSVISRAGLNSKATGWAHIDGTQVHESLGLSRSRQLGLGSSLSPGFVGRIDQILINCVPIQ